MKYLSLIIVTLTLGSSSLFANYTELFSYNKEIIETELAQLKQVEQLIGENANLTILDIKNNHSEFNDINLGTMASGFISFTQDIEPPLGIPSFLWGCVFSVSGIIIVYIMTDEDKEETKKAFNGCLVSSLSIIAIYIAAIAISASTATYYY